jgi:hypothetical protein
VPLAYWQAKMVNTNSKVTGAPSLSSPSHRYNSVVTYISKPGFSRIRKHPSDYTDYQMSLVYIHKGESNSLSEYVEEALCLFKVPACRAVMDGLCMSGAETDKIAAVALCDTQVAEAYSDLFFDASVFSNRLLRIAYIRSLAVDTEPARFRKSMISWGYHLGADYIAWKIGARDSIVVKTPEESVSDVLNDASWRSREHMLSDITDSPTKESKAWIPQVLKSAEVLKAFGSEKPVTDALKDLVFDLQGRDETLTVNDLEDIKQ